MARAVVGRLSPGRDINYSRDGVVKFLAGESEKRRAPKSLCRRLRQRVMPNPS